MNRYIKFIFFITFGQARPTTVNERWPEGAPIGTVKKIKMQILFIFWVDVITNYIDKRFLKFRFIWL